MRNNVSLKNAFKGFFRDTYLIFSVGKKKNLSNFEGKESRLLFLSTVSFSVIGIWSWPHSPLCSLLQIPNQAKTLVRIGQLVLSQILRVKIHSKKGAFSYVFYSIYFLV